MPSRVRRALGLALMWCHGCAGTPPAAAPSNTEAPSNAEASEPPAEATARSEAPAAPDAQGANPAPSGTAANEASDDDGLDADIAALSASTAPGVAGTASRTGAARDGRAAPGEPPKAQPPAGAGGASGLDAGREIVYRVTPQGLVIEVDGIHLRPEAKSFKDKSGAYGIELVVNAKSFDGRQYWVNKPSEGPLSIAGKVEGKSGKRERFGDQREGSGEEIVTEGAPRRFKQRWPGRGQPKLWAGQTVTLEVGLWGVRAESERERPVRRLFEVKMVAGNKSPAVITPPTLDWGS